MKKEENLSARFRPPGHLVQLVERPRLANRIDRAWDLKLTLIRTPAGYGKTTLLAQWLAASGSGQHVAWLALEEKDQAPQHFLVGLVDALESADVRLGALARESGKGASGASPDLVLRSILRELELFSEEIALILDDYHLAETPENDALFHTLFKLQPQNLHLIIATRTEPGFPLSKQRTAGQIQELDKEDLRFCDDDIRELLGHVIPSEDFDSIAVKTEGWPVALQLVRLWLENGAHSPSIFETLSGSHVDIASYLAEQVFLRLDPEIQDILVRTSVLEKISGDLINVLCERQDGWHILERLDGLNAFTFPIDLGRAWYRHHQLFADFLKFHLRKLGEEAVADLHIRASGWFENHGDLTNAVQHAIGAGQIDRAADLADAAGGVVLILSEGLPEFKRLVKNLPQDALACRPRLRAAQALELLKEGKLAEGQLLIEEIKHGLRKGHYDVSGDALAFLEQDILIVEALVVAYQDYEVTDQMVSGLEALARAASQSDYWFRGFVNNLLCILHFRKGNLKNARVAARAGLMQYREADAIYGMVFMYMHEGMLALVQGGLAEAQDSFIRSSDLCDAHMASDEFLRALVDVFTAEVLYEQGREDEARELIFDALPTVEAAEGWVEVFVSGYRTATALAYSRGGFKAAEKILLRGNEVADSRNLERLRGFLLARQIQFLIIEGQSQEAREIIGKSGFSVDGGHFRNPRLFGWRELEDVQLTMAHLALSENDPARGFEYLDPLLFACVQNGQRRRQIPVHILRGLAYQALADMDGAAAEVKRAIAISHSENLLRSLIDQGPAVGPLLKNVVSHVGVSGMPKAMLDWVGGALAVMWHSDTGENSLVSDLFTDRERQVLIELGAGGSNKVIARSLDITDNAVKFHLKNIYRKLGVGNRRLAFSVAQKRGLISPTGDQNGDVTASP